MGIPGHNTKIESADRTAEIEFNNYQNLILILENISDIIFYLFVEPDEKFRFKYVNNAFLLFTGLKKGQIIGRYAREIIPSTSHKLVFDNYRLAIQTGNTVSWEEVSEYPSGKKTGNVSITPVFDNSENCTHLLGTIKDITSIHNAEEKLKLSESRYQDLYENAPDMLLSVDAETSQVIQCNHTLEKKTGFLKEEIMGKPVFNLYHPNCLDVATKSFQDFLTKGELHNVELQIRKKDGGFLYVILDVSAVRNPKGKILHSRSSWRDITQLKLVEKSLKKSEIKYQTLFEQTAVGIAQIHTSTGRIIKVNKKLCSMLGYSMDEMLTMNYQSFTHPDDLPHDLDLQQNLRSSDNRNFNVQKRCICKDQSILWFNITVMPLSKKGKIPQYFMVIAADINDHKMTEKKTESSEQKFKALVEQSITGIYIFKKENFIYVNKQFAKIFGYTQDEILLNLKPTEVISQEDRLKADDYVDQRLAGSVESVHYIAQGNHKQGRELWVEIHGTHVFIDGEDVITGTVLDITERVLAERALIKSEKRLKRAQEIGKLGYWQQELNSNMIWASEEAKKIYGFPPIEGELPQEMIAACIQDINLVEQATKDLVEKNIKYDIEFAILPADGSPEKIVSAVAELERDAKGKSQRISGVLRDISQSKLAEEEIKLLNAELENRVKQRTAQLEKVNKELETFSYSVSHDLKAPLRGIDGYSKLLQDLYVNELNEEARLFISNIRKSTVQMNQLIEDLLAYSRLERQTIRNEHFKIQNLVNSIKSQIDDDLEIYKIKFINTIPDIELTADIQGLIIALRNLIENAVKFSKKSTDPLIETGLTETDRYWNIWVRDNGIGFDMKYHNRIFEIFQRLHRTEDYPGTGIGLAMVSKAMQRMGGRVWATSKPGIGSTFNLEIVKPQ
ncbi:MAG: PAS domain S-box protein [Bacteroidales bacterium]|nr:PAS domain S-box protein [Bacteroidales bacterium]